MGTDYTYAEKTTGFTNAGSLGKKYDTPINESVAAEVVTELTSDADYLEALSDKFSGDAEYLAGVGAALAADSTFLAAIAAELYSSAPLDSVDFTISAEAASQAETIDVEIQLKDADDVAFAERTVVSVWFTSDANGTVPADLPAAPIFSGAGGFTAAGGVLEEITALRSYTMVTDATGKLAFQIVDAGGVDQTAYCVVMLPNGKIVVGVDDLLWES